MDFSYLMENGYKKRNYTNSKEKIHRSEAVGIRLNIQSQQISNL